ncbi:MAG: hypothetical protein ACXAB7_21425 [Candidatus Kariarchaeaceae archaeon]
MLEDERRTQRKITAIETVTDVTVRDQYKELVRKF